MNDTDTPEAAAARDPKTAAWRAAETLSAVDLLIIASRKAAVDRRELDRLRTAEPSTGDEIARLRAELNGAKQEIAALLEAAHAFPEARPVPGEYPVPPLAERIGRIRGDAELRRMVELTHQELDKAGAEGTRCADLVYRVQRLRARGTTGPEDPTRESPSAGVCQLIEERDLARQQRDAARDIIDRATGVLGLGGVPLDDDKGNRMSLPERLDRLLAERKSLATQATKLTHLRNALRSFGDPAVLQLAERNNADPDLALLGAIGASHMHANRRVLDIAEDLGVDMSEETGVDPEDREALDAEISSVVKRLRGIAGEMPDPAHSWWRCPACLDVVGPGVVSDLAWRHAGDHMQHGCAGPQVGAFGATLIAAAAAAAYFRDRARGLSVRVADLEAQRDLLVDRDRARTADFDRLQAAHTGLRDACLKMDELTAENDRLHAENSESSDLLEQAEARIAELEVECSDLEAKLKAALALEGACRWADWAAGVGHHPTVDCSDEEIQRSVERRIAKLEETQRTVYAELTADAQITRIAALVDCPPGADVAAEVEAVIERSNTRGERIRAWSTWATQQGAPWSDDDTFRRAWIGDELRRLRDESGAWTEVARIVTDLFDHGNPRIEAEAALERLDGAPRDLLDEAIHAVDKLLSERDEARDRVHSLELDGAERDALYDAVWTTLGLKQHDGEPRMDVDDLIARLLLWRNDLLAERQRADNAIVDLGRERCWVHGYAALLSCEPDPAAVLVALNHLVRKGVEG